MSTRRGGPVAAVALAALALASTGAGIAVDRARPAAEPVPTVATTVEVTSEDAPDVAAPTAAPRIPVVPSAAQDPVPAPEAPDGTSTGRSGTPTPDDGSDTDAEVGPDEPTATTGDASSGPGAGHPEGRGADTLLPALDLDAVAAAAERTGIPTRALAAYASAALRLGEEQPGCNLSWVTLAGIGWVESHHGEIDGGRLGDDGRPARSIVGVPLDGGPGVRAIADTDGGRWDGDARWDRAVGPMQFIPSTWSRWQVDASGEGEADPQHIDDAALAAGRYLCAGGRDLTVGEHWGRAVFSYNRSGDYVHAVLDAADAYAVRAGG